MLGRRAFLSIAACFLPLARMVGVAQSFSLEDFLTLSSRLTGHANLDRAAAGTFLKALASSANATKLTRPDAALERQIIAAWYTGAHDVGGERRLVTHIGALKWRAMGIPVPGMCAGRFGAWSQPPRTANR